MASTTGLEPVVAASLLPSPEFSPNPYSPPPQELEEEENQAESRTGDEEGTGRTLDTAFLLQSWPHKSGHVVEEMLSTEKTYLESLEDIINGYLKPLYEFLLQESQGPRFVETVFCNIRRIHAVHQQVYDSLLLVYDNPSQFGKVFETHSTQFREYIRYCTNFPSCETMLQQTMKSSSETQGFIIKCQQQLGHPLPLITYLHKPVQRILKYKLLLEQILKKFPENTAGHKELRAALSIMSDLAHEINEVKKRQENVTRVKHIEKQLKGLKGSEICGASLLSYGHLLFEVNCKVIGRRGGERTLLLFERMLLFLKKMKNKTGYIYKGLIKVKELDLTDDPNKVMVLKIFSIQAPSKRFVIQVRSGKVKEELVQHIQNLLVSQIKAQTEPPPPPPPPAPVEDEEKENNQILGHINNNKRPRMDNLLRQRSLAASTDLQHRRKTRQLSTRKFTLADQARDDSALSGSADENLCLPVKTESETREEEYPQKLQRKSAFRRRKIKKQEGLSSDSHISRSWDGHISLDDSMTSPDLISNLDRIPRALTFSEDSHSSGEFIYPETHQRHNTVMATGLRERADMYPVPPDPYDILGRDRVLSDATLVEEEEEEEKEAVEEEEEEEKEDEEETGGRDEEREVKMEEEKKTAIIPNTAIERRIIFSRRFEDSDESLGSNASSMCLEDHYLLSQTAKSAIIAGRDGEDIVIYDDTEDSESEYEYEEEEEEEEEGEEEEGEEERVEREENGKRDSPEPEDRHTSLRSYLSTTNLLSTEQLFYNSKSSPLSTLPRSRGAGLNSPLLYSRKKQFKRSVTSDALQSLPSHKSMDSLSSTSNSDHSLSDTDPTNDEQQSEEQLNNDDELRDECSSPRQQEEREMVSPEIEERKNGDMWIMPHGGFEDSFEQQPLTLSSSIYIRHDSPATEGREEGGHTEESTVLTQQVMEPGPAVILADNSVLMEEQGEQCNEDVPSLDSFAQPQEQPPPLDDEQHHHQAISVSTELSISKEEELPLASNEQIQATNGEGLAVSDEKMQSFGVEEESMPSADSDVVPVVELGLIPTDNVELTPEESATNAVSSSKEESMPSADSNVVPVVEPGLIPTDNVELIPEESATNAVSSSKEESMPSADSDVVPVVEPGLIPTDNVELTPEESATNAVSSSKEESMPSADSDVVPVVEPGLIPTDNVELIPEESATNAVSSSKEESMPSADSNVVPVVEPGLIPTDNVELIPEESATNAVSSSEEESTPIEDLTPASNEEESLLTNKVDSSSKESINMEPIPTSNEDILTDMTTDDTSSQLLEDNTPTNVETNDEETLSIEDNQVTHFNGNISIDKKHINDEESKTDRPLSNDNDLESPKELRSRNVAKSINLSTTIKESASTDDTPKWRDIETVVVLKYGAAGILSNYLSSFSQQSLLLCLTIIGLVLFFIVMLSYNYFFYYRSGTA